jgi:hypothetical protein
MDGKDDVAEAPANGTCSNNGCDQGEGAVPKTASQLKKEAKRLAKLEKFTKKQNQMASKDGASNEVRTLIYFFQNSPAQTCHVVYKLTFHFLTSIYKFNSFFYVSVFLLMIICVTILLWIRRATLPML